MTNEQKNELKDLALNIVLGEKAQKEIGPLIRACRKASGISQGQLARGAGIKQSHLCDAELWGRPLSGEQACVVLDYLCNAKRKVSQT